jgi:hypothetical protein
MPPYGAPAGLRWHIGRTDIHPGNTDRVPIGDLVLTAPGAAGDMRIDLWNAEATGHVTTAGGTIAVRSFTHTDQIVQVIEITPDAATQNAQFSWVPAVSETASTMGNIKLSDRPGVCSTAWTEVPGSMGSRVVFLSVGATQQEAIDNVNRAVMTGLDALVASHRTWWNNFWKQSFLSIPDTRMESFYWMQLYKMASGTRSGRPILDLIGPWFRYSPWLHLWWNLNIQLTYWVQLTSNHLDLGESLLQTLDSHKAQLASNAGAYSSDSYAIGGHSSNFDLAKPVANFEANNLTWALHNYYLQYRYSMDDAMLRDRLYPLLKGAINFDLHNLMMGSDGHLHMPIGFSPEYPGQPQPDPDANYELALINWGCQTLLDITKRLSINDPQIPDWQNTLAKLLPYPTDANGWMVSATVPFAVSHRHYSHMLMVFPLYIVNPETPNATPLITQTLTHWLSLQGGLRGFSYTGAASMYSMLGQGDTAAQHMNTLMDTLIHPNTMYTEAGPVIESPLSGGAAVADMLLTSWGGKLRVFPGVAKAWTEVAFRDLRAQGAFLVSAVRKGGVVQFIRIVSLAGEPCVVVTDMPNPGVQSGNAGVSVSTTAPGEYTVTMKQGDTVVLTAGGAAVDTTIAPVPAQAGKTNFWGLK